MAPKAVLESQAGRAAAAGRKRPPCFAGDAVAEVAAEEAAPGRVFFLGGEGGAEEVAEEGTLGAPLALARLNPSAGAATRVLLSQGARGWSAAGAAPPPESTPARGEAGAEEAAEEAPLGAPQALARLTPSAGAAGTEGGTSVLLSQGACGDRGAWPPPAARGAWPPPVEAAAPGAGGARAGAAASGAAELRPEVVAFARRVSKRLSCPAALLAALKSLCSRASRLLLERSSPSSLSIQTCSER